MRTILNLCLCFICGCAAPVYQDLPSDTAPPSPIKTPHPIRQKYKTFASSSSIRQVDFQIPIFDDQDTNSYYFVPLTWSYSVPATFKMYHGTNSRSYTEVIDCGSTNVCIFLKTNWSLEYVPRYFAVTATVYGLESNYSKELRWPPYPPDRVTLAWSNPASVEILTATNLLAKKQAWTTIAVSIPGTTTFTTMIDSLCRYFATRRTNGVPEEISLTAWNPLN